MLPGVGAFADCRRGLDAIPGMIDALNESVRKQGRPFFGICVGMQLMAERGREYQVTPGLGWIAGEVDRIAPNDPSLKIPHMGWNTLNMLQDPPAARRIFRSAPTGCTPISCTPIELKPAQRDDLVAQADYGGPLTAIVGRDNMVGTQFHPEKSQRLGPEADREFLEVDAMILFPAIDLKDGLAVRLQQGDMARATMFPSRSGGAGARLRDCRASNICTSSISTAPSPASR